MFTFPIPGGKKKHRKRRVLNESSIINLTRCLRPGGRFHFWTDVLDYFEDTVELIAEITPILGVPYPRTKSKRRTTSTIGRTLSDAADRI